MTRQAHPPALLDVIRARNAKRVGDEWRFQCPYPERHRQGDAHPSARFHPEKAVWCCDVCDGHGGWIDLCRQLGVEVLRPQSQHPERQRPKVVACYDYYSESGEILRRKLRWEPGFNNRSKSFTWQKPDGDGWVSCRGDGNPKVLYGSHRLPDARSQDTPVLVVEGEKDCDTASALNLVAVCNPEGASDSQRSKWCREYCQQLDELAVVVIADKDPPGRAHARNLVRALESCAKEVRYLELPGEEVNDLSDWVSVQRGQGLDAETIRQALRDLCLEASPANEIEALVEKAGPPEPSFVDRTAETAPQDLATILTAIEQSTDLDTIEPLVRQLATAAAQLNHLDRNFLREKTITVLQGKVSAPASLFDSAVKADIQIEADHVPSGRSISFTEPAPWPEPVDGAALLGDLDNLLQRYVALGPGAAEAIVLWILHTYTFEHSQVSPLLLISSPEKRCGKTTLLTLLTQLVHHPLPASNITPAALFRTIEAYGPTLLIDEADTFLHQSEELRGVLNSGHARATAFVVRTVGESHEPRQFSTWSPKAVALIGRPPSTLEDRSVSISMRRKTVDETVERLRLDQLEQFLPFRSRITRWASDHARRLHGHDPDIPSMLQDRAADNWRPLLAIADVVGPPWPERARRAAQILETDDEQEDSSPGVTLLSDIQDLFERRGTDILASQDIVTALIERDDRPWAEWKRGQPLSVVQLARLLKPFRVRPQQLRVGMVKIRGYARSSFQEPFSRYLPPSKSVHPVQPATTAAPGHFPTRYSQIGQGEPQEDLSSSVFKDVPTVPGCDPVQTGGLAPEGSGKEVIEL